MHMIRCVRHLLPMLLLATGCMKDKALPPDQPNTGDVRLTFDLRYGAMPFQLGHGYLFTEGRTIHFTKVKVLLSGFHMLDATGRTVGTASDVPIMIDADGPAEVPLGPMPAVPLGDLGFRLGLHAALDQAAVSNAAWPLDQADMLVDNDPAYGRYTLLLEGFIDQDGDGVFAAHSDRAFSYRPYGQAVPTWCTVSPVAPQSLGPGGHITRNVRLNVLFMLLGVDVINDPLSQGQETMATTVLWNTGAAVE